MQDSVTGQKPGPVDFYKGTPCRQATGSWVHPRASEIWEEMDTLRSQPTPDGTQWSEPEILSQVLGTRSGYVHGFGHGAKLMAPARATSSRSIVVGDSAVRRADTAEKEVQQLWVVVDDIKDQLDRQRKEQERKMMDQLARQREEQERRMEEELARQREEQERRMEEMRVEHERRMMEMFQVIAARLPTDAPGPPPASV
ncbi:uncharacterized protein LOC131250670 [Magnolia sinica]|uniref:uncharacterized protein LOC131250670 n=1 Tax=Magnolia sinica TaxID=86752 RepID=UPI002657B6F0|nr:uncharacterized protein LOC131250670 [Magnolia sinica]